MKATSSKLFIKSKILKVAVIMEIDRLLGEHIVIELGAVIICHRCHVVDDDLVRLCLEVRKSRVIMVVLYEVNVMLEYRRGLVGGLDIVKQLQIHSVHDRSDLIIEHLGYLIGIIYLCVIITLCASHKVVVLSVEHNIGLAVAVLYYVDLKIVDDLGVEGSDASVLSLGKIGIRELSLSGVLTVLAKICDDIAYSHNTALEGRGNDLDNIGLIDITALHHSVKELKVVHRLRAILVHLELAVMGDYTVQGIESEVVMEDAVKNSYGVDIVIEVSAALRLIHLADILLSRVTEGSVSDIVAERDSLDEIEVEIKRRADSTRYSRNELNMQCSSGDIVVLVEREHLCLIGISIIIRAMQNLVGIAGISGTPDGLKVARGISAHSKRALAREVGSGVVCYILSHSLGKLRRELLVV